MPSPHSRSINKPCWIYHYHLESTPFSVSTMNIFNHTTRFTPLRP